MRHYSILLALAFFLITGGIAQTAPGGGAQSLMMGTGAPTGGGGGGGGTGVACTLGPNYTGTVPAGATAAGMTQCAFNAPFSSASFTTNQWLDCAGAPSPLLFLTFVTSSTLSAQGCGAYALVTDGGGQVLRIRLPPTTGNTAASLFSIKPDQTAGQKFPANQYVEFRYRLANNVNSLCGGSTTSCDQFQFFIYGQSLTAQPPWLEWDWMEVYTGTPYNGPTGRSCIHSGMTTTYSPSSNAGCDPTGYNASGSGTQANTVADQTAYHTYGVRLVTDGAGTLDGVTNGNMTKCGYLDGVLVQCTKYTYNNHSAATQDSFALRQQLQMQSTFCPADPGCSVTGNVLSANLDVFVDHLTIWECPAWVPTGLNQPGTDICRNTTADVTGRLAAAP